MSNKKYGLKYERTEKHYWEAQPDTFCFRSRGSFSLFDLIVASPLNWTLISVKATKQEKFAFKREIEEIKAFKSAPAETKIMLVLYQKGKRRVLFEKVVGQIPTSPSLEMLKAVYGVET